MIYTIGIDPGAKGAICIFKDTKIYALFKFDKTIRSWIPIFEKFKNKDTIVYLEEVHSMPKQGVKSMFSFGQRFGEIIGALESFKYEYKLVAPKIWQKDFFELMGKKRENFIDVKEGIASIINDNKIQGKFDIARARVDKINTDLTDAIAIAYTYSRKV